MPSTIQSNAEFPSNILSSVIGPMHTTRYIQLFSSWHLIYLICKSKSSTLRLLFPHFINVVNSNSSIKESLFYLPIGNATDGNESDVITTKSLFFGFFIDRDKKPKWAPTDLFCPNGTHLRETLPGKFFGPPSFVLKKGYSSQS